MNTKKLIWWIELILFSVLIAFIIPIVFEWIQTRTLEITTAGIKDALFFGIFVTAMVMLARSIKNDFLVVFVSLLIICLLLLFFKFGISI
jgi:hypothetical protein